MNVFCIISYLAAIVFANGLVSRFGQAALPFTAFVLIPFDLMARDVLHERWKVTGYLLPKMALLICSGSALSYLTTVASAQVSVASATSFFLTGIADVVAYCLLDKYPRTVKMNGSNFFSAWVDSIVFPLVAFGAIIPSLSAAQAMSKFIGGFVWTLLFLAIWRKPK